VSQTRRALVLGAGLVLGAVSAAHAQGGLRAIWGSGPADVWAVGSASTALHFDGQAWTQVPFGVPVSGYLSAVWGSGPNSVFVGGEEGTILRWNGRAWTRMTVPTDRAIVALAGRSALNVYALAQSYNDREAPTLLHWDGRAWTPTPLPLPFQANALSLAGASVLVAGFVMNDPTPDQRRAFGVLARRVAARWAMTGWNGRLVTDRVVAGAGWYTVGAVGPAILLTGEREDGERALALSRGATFTLLPPVGAAAAGSRVTAAFLAADGVPVAFLDQGGLARYLGGAWVAAGGGAQMMQAPQLAQNPMAFALEAAAWSDIGNTNAAWGPSSDFLAVTDNGRIIRVQGSGARIVYDASCADPRMAGINPVCQGLAQQQGVASQQAPRLVLPMPSRRVKP